MRNKLITEKSVRRLVRAHEVQLVKTLVATGGATGFLVGALAGGATRIW